jgi:hypothetical protein
MRLENGTLLEVGKKYKSAQWHKGFVTITALGRDSFLGIYSKVVDETGLPSEDTWFINESWLPYEEEKKDKWYKVLEQRSRIADIPENNEYDKVIIFTTEPGLEDIILREWDSKEQMINDLKK